LDLSVVIPAFDEETRLGATVRHVCAYLRARELSAEVIVVDDGSRDGTPALLRSLAVSDARVCAVTLPRNRGKGAAVAAGVAATRGAVVLLCDADLSAPIEELAGLEAALAAGADVAIGSRFCRGARVELAQPWARFLMGRAFNLLVRALLLPRLRDTQCGFKLFRGADARELFGRARVNGFAYDVEVLLLARLHGLRVAEVPVRWLHAERSRVLPVRHSAQMLRDVLRLAARRRRLAVGMRATLPGVPAGR
jgi:dolichyl-phosphate beta-glucosyltransferase